MKEKRNYISLYKKKAPDKSLTRTLSIKVYMKL